MKCYEVELADFKGNVHKVRLMTDNPNKTYIANFARETFLEGCHIHTIPFSERIREVDGI